MKLQLSQTVFLDLVENGVFDMDQAEIIVNNMALGKNDPLPYVTKKQLKIFRQMGLVKI